jgi:hypothetical protein
MVDWVVIVTPVLVVGVLLLLGFAGCETFFPLVGPNDLEIVVRVPTTLPVPQIDYRCDEPGGGSTQFLDTQPTAESTDGLDSLYSHSCGVLIDGAWTVRVRVTANDGVSAQITAQGTFTLDGSDATPVATFQASGTPSGGDFAVAFVGVI